MQLEPCLPAPACPLCALPCTLNPTCLPALRVPCPALLCLQVVNGSPVMPDKDLRYYSRGLFNSPLITHLDGSSKGGFAQQVQVGALTGLTGPAHRVLT